MSVGRRGARGALALAIAIVAVLAFSAPARAANEANLAVRTLDTTAWPTVKLTVQYTGKNAPALQDFTVRNHGAIVQNVTARPLTETKTPVGVVLVIDTSGSMREQGRMEAAKAAAQAFIAGRGPLERIAVIAFNDAPTVVQPFSSDGRAALAVADLQAAGGTALWDAVRLAAGLFSNEKDVQPNIVVLSDGADSASTASLIEARNAAIAAHAVVHTVGFSSSSLDGAGLNALAHDTGGQALVTTTTASVGDLFAEVRRSLDEQFELTFKATGEPALDLTVSVKDASTTARGAAGSVSHERATRPERIAEPGTLTRIAQTVGRPLAILAAAGIAVLAVLGIAFHITNGRGLVDRLRAYEGDSPGSEEDEEPLAVNLTSAMTRGFVDRAATAIEGRGVLEWVERKLAAAHLPVRAAEAAFVTLAFALVLTVIAFVFSGFFLAVAALVFGLGTPAGVLVFLGFRRKRKFLNQLPSMLQLLASSLRAGYALLQGCEAVAREMEDPMGGELRRVLAEARLGKPLDEALEDAAQRMDSPDFSWVVMAISIQRNVGGNLAELLDTVAETMTSRTRLRREVKALTAEGRMSAIVLCVMPPALCVAMMVMSPGYIDPLFDQTVGKIMLGVGITMLVGGFLWMQKIIKVDV